MTNSEKTKLAKAEKIGAILDELYPEPPIPLDHKDGFTLTIAVLLSAQCTDKRVNMVTPDLFDLADNPFDMAELSVEEILGAIRSCGLAPTKAKRIKKLSEMLVEQGGELPDTLTGLQKLPGVGRKTAQVVMAQWYGEPAFPVDTHIHRLAERWGLSNGKNVRQTEKDLRALFPKESWNLRHLQIIFFGREYCPARGHEPEVCPICKWAG
jgi:endonuclease-3